MSTSDSSAHRIPKSFSHSGMASWRRCRMQFYWKYVKGYIPASSHGQVRGTVGHSIFAKFYSLWDKPLLERAKQAIKVAHDQIEVQKQKTGVDLGPEWEELRNIIVRYFQWADKNDDFEPIKVELLSNDGSGNSSMEPAIEVKFEIPFGKILLNGVIDGLVKDANDRVWILEHKFLERASAKHLDLDPQINVYLLAADMLGFKPEGVIYNIIRMKEGGIAEKEPVLRVRAYRNYEGLVAIRKEIELQMADMLNFYRVGGYIYRTPTRDCNWDCSFYLACCSINDSGSAEPVLRNIPIEPYEGEPDNGSSGE